MIISIEEFRTYVDTDMKDAVLGAKLQALELSLRKYTNNNFQQIGIRYQCPAMAQKLYITSSLLSVGDTIQISKSIYNDGIYVIKDIANDGLIELDKTLIDESAVMVTKVVYPMDVKMGVIEIMKWIIRNDEKNSGDTSKKDIQSETISRHSVTYAQDATESDINTDFGCPKKYTAFMNHYKKARF